MNILGIGPGELVLILVILLLVVGPERLPDLARQGGRMLVRVRNWVQHSPDAAMVLRARQEIEQELALLRSSLMEVQNARDEVIQAAKQINQTVTDDVLGAAKDAAKLVSEQPLNSSPAQTASPPPEGQPVARASSRVNSIAPPSSTEPTSSTEPPTPLADVSLAPEPETTPGHEPLVAADRPALVSDQAQPAQQDKEGDEQPVAADLAAPVSDQAQQDETDQLRARLQALMDDLQALQAELRQRGLLGAEWQPPSARPLPTGAPPMAPGHNHEGHFE